MMPHIVSCKNISRIYQQGNIQVTALSDITLAIDRGEFTSLVGPSGSGKTTLLNIIGGLDVPTSGEIVVVEKRIDTMTNAQKAEFRLNHLGFIFQTYNLVPVLSVLENVEFVMELQEIPKKERRERALSMLQEVGLSGLEQRRPHELSGGQQQRVAVARAIVANPSLVLADEPTANLDSHTAENLLQLMKKLNEEKSITFIFSTHDARVMSYAKRLIGLKDGKIDSDETKR